MDLKIYKSQGVIWASLVVFLVVYVKQVVPDQFAGWGDFAVLFLVQASIAVSTVMWAIPWGNRRPGHEWWRIPLALLAQGAVAVVVLVVVSYLSGGIKLVLDDGGFVVFIDNIWAVVMVLVPGILMGLLFAAVQWGVQHQSAQERLEHRLRDRQQSLDKYEQVWLQMELPSHLLFNSLSVVRHLALHDAQSAVKATRVLSELMKFYVSKRQEEFIPLDVEMEQVGNLIQIYEYRNKQALPFAITLPARADKIPVLPMSILLLVENMCRYGHLDVEGNPWKVEITHSGDTIEVRTENPLSPAGRSHTEGLGKGILNLQNRLALQYGDNHEFSITTHKDLYIVRYFFYLRGS